MAIAVDRIDSGPPYGSNCYVVRAGADAGDAVVVDPGGDPSGVLAALQLEGARLAGILVTHGDVDHVAGVAGLSAATGAEVWMPVGEADVLRRGTSRTGQRVEPHEPEHLVADGDRLELGGLTIEVVGVAGHSPDHVAYCADGAVFAGDLIFAGSVGRTDLPGGDHGALLASVARLLERCGAGARVYPGHGEETTLGAELERNPFLGPLRAR